MALQEIKKEIEVGGGASEEIRYWEFPMLYAGHDRKYYTTLLDDHDGNQVISFSESEANAEWMIRYKDPYDADLAIPFVEFSRAARLILDAEPHDKVTIATDKGSFEKLNDDTVQYETACGMRFIISRENLEALAR